MQVSDIDKIFFQLSTLCNYSFLHSKCPLHIAQDKIVMPAKTVYTVLEQAAAHKYKNTFAFHVYNEPTNDPRLFLFTSATKKYCPGSKNHIYTNGFYMTQEIADELISYGIDSMMITLYTENEKERISAISFPVPVDFLDYSKVSGMDDRIDFYNENCGAGGGDSLYCKRGSPFSQFNISPRGDVFLCCYDWKHKYIFGNVNESTLGGIISQPLFKKWHDELKQGTPVTPLCLRCPSMAKANQQSG